MDSYTIWYLKYYILGKRTVIIPIILVSLFDAHDEKKMNFNLVCKWIFSPKNMEECTHIQQDCWAEMQRLLFQF